MTVAMVCPKCGSKKIGVVRTEVFRHSRVRLRICYNCRYTFETIEKVAGTNIFDKSRQVAGLKKKKR